MLTVDRPRPAEETAEQRQRPTPKERRTAGTALRATAPLEEHAAFSRTPESRDPVTLLEEQAVTRLPDLARAHARSGDRIAIDGYLGSSAAFENALADFGETYADVNDGDHGRLAEAAATGRVPAQSDL